MTSVAIIILNFNGKDLTTLCLESLKKIKLPNIIAHTLLIDNNSHDGSVSHFQTHFPEIELVSTTENLGFAAGNNFGVQKARQLWNPDFYLLLNNDTTVDPKFLQYLIDFALQHPQGLLFFPKIYFAPGYEFHKDKYTKSEQGKVIWFAGAQMDWNNVYGSHIGVDEVDTGQFDQPRQLELGTGCCVLVDKHVLKNDRIFDNKFFLYYEDTDLCLKVHQQGKELWFVPDSHIWHINSGSSGSGSGLHDYFLTRNRLLIGMRYFSLRTKQALIRESLKFLIFGRTWQRKGVIDFYLHKFGRGSYPVK